MKHTGNLEITKDNLEKYKDLTEVSGNLSIYSNAELKADSLKTVGGDLSINSKLDENFEKRLWGYNSKNQWFLTEQCSDFLLSKKGKINYKIEGISFEKDLFDKVRLDKLSAREVFSLKNTEERRIAYQKMDKAKMKEFGNFKVLDETTDKYNNPMKLVEFTIVGFDTPFRYYNCICPSTGREYFLETRSVKCNEAKVKSFGFDELVFDEEY